MVVDFGKTIKLYCYHTHLIHYALSANTLLLRLWLEGNIIQPRLRFSDGQASFHRCVQIIQGPGSLVAVQIVDCGLVLQRLRRLQSMSKE